MCFYFIVSPQYTSRHSTFTPNTSAKTFQRDIKKQKRKENQEILQRKKANLNEKAEKWDGKRRIWDDEGSGEKAENCEKVFDIFQCYTYRIKPVAAKKCADYLKIASMEY